MIFPDAQPTPITSSIIAASIMMVITDGISFDTIASMKPPNVLVVNLDSFAFNTQELE